MFENPRRGRQARNFTTNVTKILNLKSFSEQIFFRKLPLGAPEKPANVTMPMSSRSFNLFNTAQFRARVFKTRIRIFHKSFLKLDG